jgi:hypothetical protein
MYLHEAIRQVLEERGNAPMRIEEIADIINQQRLYIREDGSQIDARQVGWRAVGDVTKGNPPQFEVVVRLRQGR